MMPLFHETKETRSVLAKGGKAALLGRLFDPFVKILELNVRHLNLGICDVVQSGSNQTCSSDTLLLLLVWCFTLVMAIQLATEFESDSTGERSIPPNTHLKLWPVQPNLRQLADIDRMQSLLNVHRPVTFSC